MDKSKAAKIIFGNKEKKQFPDPEGLEREKPSSAIEGSTQPLGFETRLRAKFSEQANEIGMETRHRDEMKTKGMRQTFAKRSSVRPKHLQHPAPVQGGHYKQTPQMEKPHYEEYEKMENKTFTQFVTEAKRGRPRKLKPGEKADTEHLQDQLSKLTHANHVMVHFKNGEKHEIPRAHANKALIHLSGLKPIHRADHVEHMHSSKENFYHTLASKSIPSKKKTITLAGPKLRKEEVEQIDEVGDTPRGRKALADYIKNSGGTSMDSVGGLMYQAANADPTAKDNRRVDLFKKAGKRAKGIERAAARLAKEEHEDDDGWYAHKEMHGKDAVSKEDWKKGIRKKPAVKKEEVEQIDEVSKDKLQRYMHSAAPERRDPEKGDKRKAGMKLAIKKVLGSDELGKKPKIKATKEEVETDEKKKKDHHKLLQKFRHRIDEIKAIKGTHATKLHAAKVIHPDKVGYAGKQTKPKVQNLRREDYAPLEAGEKQTHVDQKTADAKTRKQGAEKPKKPKMEMTKEAWALYDTLSDKNKAIFEKMDAAERDALVDKYISGKR